MSDHDENEQLMIEDAQEAGPSSPAAALRSKASQLVSRIPRKVGNLFKRTRDFDTVSEGDTYRSYPDFEISNPRKSKRISKSVRQAVVQDSSSVEGAEYVEQRSITIIQRCEAKLRRIVKINKSGKPRKLSAKKQNEVDDLRRQLAFHQEQLQLARSVIGQSERRTHELEERDHRTQEQLRQAATEVVTAVERTNRTIQRANQIAENAGAQIANTQASNAALQQQVEELSSQKDRLAELLVAKQAELQDITADRERLILEREVKLDKAAREKAGLIGNLQKSKDETADYKNRLKACQDQVDKCNSTISTLTSDLTALTRTNHTESERLSEELATVRNDLAAQISSSEEKIQSYKRDLQIARDNLTVLQNQNSSSANQQATLVATLRNDLQVAKDSLARSLTNNDDAVRKLRSQIHDQSVELAALRNAAPDQRSLLELQALKQKNAEHLQQLQSLKKKDADNQQIIANLTSRTTSTIVNASNMDLSELVAIPLREKIPHFSGYLGDQRVQDWFKEAERVARGGNWTKDQMKRYFSERFTNLAQSFQEKVDETTFRAVSYEDWKKRIIEEFKDPAESAIFKAELSSLKQRDKERVRDFAARVEKIFAKGYGEAAFNSTNDEMTSVREEVLRTTFQDGLRADIAPGYWYRVKPDAPYADSVKVATEVESVVCRKNSSTGQVHEAAISALGLNQEELTGRLQSIEEKLAEMNISNSSQVSKKEKNGGISVVSTGAQPNGKGGKPRERSRDKRVRFNRSALNGKGDDSKYRGYSDTSRSRSRSRSRDRTDRRRSPELGKTRGGRDHSERGYRSSESDSEYFRDQRSRSPICCYNCGKLGHKQSECRMKTRQRGRGRGRPSR